MTDQSAIEAAAALVDAVRLIEHLGGNAGFQKKAIAARREQEAEDAKPIDEGLALEMGFKPMTIIHRVELFVCAGCWFALDFSNCPQHPASLLYSRDSHGLANFIKFVENMGDVRRLLEVLKIAP